MKKVIPDGCDCPAAAESVRLQIHQQVDQAIAFCENSEASFYEFEKALVAYVRVLGSLFVSLFLVARHQRLDLKSWLPGYRIADEWSGRILETIYGPVRFGRAYLARLGGGGGFHPLDAVLGLTRDRFSPWVISLATRLTARLSFKASQLVCRAFLGWSPSTESLEHLVLGLGRSAKSYMASAPPFPEADGEMLMIEVDGKAVPTATDEELKKRRDSRRQRHDKGCGCGCQRHRGKAKRRRRGSKKRRKKGDKKKNGRSATLVVMYTLRRGPDGLLHGPINKRVWGSFARRKVTMAWARDEATRRGFPPDTTKQIQIIVDGEECLALGLKKLFPQAEFTLDIRHVEERLWAVGRAFHREGSDELRQWVEEFRTVLYTKGGAALLECLQRQLLGIPPQGPGNKNKRKAVQGLIKYLEKRLDMMNYPDRIAKDMVIASGVVEGAVRHVVGERMDCSGMRWVKGKAEAVLRLRCVEINGNWDHFFEWTQHQCREKLTNKEVVLLRTEKPIDLKEAA